jgi:undecaprenyl-diphosphatase
MTSRPSDNPGPGRAASRTRGHFRLFWDIVFRLLRWILRHVHGAYTTFGVFLLAGTIIGIAGTWGFTELAGHVVSGKTQAFDDAVLQWLASYRRAWLTGAMVEITALGTGLVVGMTVVITGMFMYLTQHKHSALLLGVATLGGLVLNTLLKAGFGRPRPGIVEWGTHAASSSFPSGHAMNSVIVYGTVAYLAARLQPRRSTRVLTLSFAALIIVLVCGSRLYLGVHYPSDVLAGMAIGLAWAAFCMATLEALQLFARRNAPQMLKDEKPAPKDAEDAESAVGLAANTQAVPADSA